MIELTAFPTGLKLTLNRIPLPLTVEAQLVVHVSMTARWNEVVVVTFASFVVVMGLAKRHDEQNGELIDEFWTVRAVLVKFRVMSNPLINPASVTFTSIVNFPEEPIVESITALDFFASLKTPRSALLPPTAWAFGTLGRNGRCTIPTSENMTTTPTNR